MALVVIGICYMCILAVENFFYNLFAEYVKDCEARMADGNPARSLREFSAAESKRVGPFHHSFVFALLIVALGNSLIAGGVGGPRRRLLLLVANWAFFVLIFWLWRPLVFPWLVLPLQRIFDVSDPDKNWLWKLWEKKIRRWLWSVWQKTKKILNWPCKVLQRIWKPRTGSSG